MSSLTIYNIMITSISGSFSKYRNWNRLLTDTSCCIHRMPLIVFRNRIRVTILQEMIQQFIYI